MTIQEQQRAAREFAERWNGRGYEKGEGQIFWIDLLGNVFGVAQPTEFITFESQVKLDHTSFIDGFIDATKVMIEQKSLGKNLKAGITQSDGSLLSPFQQAKRYAAELPYSKRPRWIVTCNFAEFLVYDMEQPNGEPYHIALADLEKEYYRLQFLVDTGKEHLRRELEVSKKAGEIIGVIYDKLLERYTTSPNPSKGGESYTVTNSPSLGGGRGEVLHSLNMLCVRLVFCLYAEDAGVFGSKQQFGDYLKQFAPKDIRNALLNLFKVLDTPIAERERFLEPELAAFPYVNGGLFSVEDRNIPQFTEELKDLLCRKASDDFDWSEISPTIFGAIFESTLNPETRRSGGMHYTSIENIHKVIDPLFLDALYAEFEECMGNVHIGNAPRKAAKPQSNAKEDRQAVTNRFSLQKLHEKIAGLRFLDPACGSGNFLTETYISLRRLENKIISALNKGQSVIGFNADYSPIKVGIHQFYGIEINDFAVTVARTALWIAEHQMLRETQAIVAHDLDFLPLKSYNNIIEGNALTIDWGDLLANAREDAKTQGLREEKINVAELSGLASLRETSKTFDYIMGNPPFVGTKLTTEEQRKERIQVFGSDEYGKLDYVACWYKKAADYMGGAVSRRSTEDANSDNGAAGLRTSQTRCAFVSTNSICQGEQVELLWKPLFEHYNLHIDFAYRTFRWDSESNSKAHVHCVIVGFNCQGEAISNRLPQDNATNQAITNRFSLLYDESGNPKIVKNINAYLLEGETVFLTKRQKPLCKVPQMTKGSQLIDGGYYVFTPQDKEDFISKYPESAPYFYRYINADAFLNNRDEKWCLCLKGCSPHILKNCAGIRDLVQKVYELRINSTAASTKKLADRPAEFFITNIPQGQSILVPVVSSERRRYIPLGFISEGVIYTNATNYIDNATLYHFGILTSNVHNAWMRAVCGRLEMRYRYSKDIVYNNFPWPQGEAICNRLQAVENRFSLRAKIERTAQGILDARAKYPDCSLADLYDERFMPADLRKAHRENDKAVMEAYGFTVGMSESECVARLMERYKEMAK